MADGEGGILTTNAEQLAEKLETFAASLSAQIAPWSQMVVTEVNLALQQHYGQKLAALWDNNEMTPPEVGQLAHVRTGTTNPYVMSYEFGTRPHDIVAHNIALKFEKNGELLYRHMVHHPGSGGHHQSAALEAAIERACTTEWSDALATIFANFQSE